MAKNTVKAFIIIKLEANTKESGSMIKSTDMESSNMQMAIDTKAHGKMEKDQIMASINTPMAMFMTESGKTISKKDMESFRWPQAISMREIGKAERKMAQVINVLVRSLHFRKWRYLRRVILEWKPARRRSLHMDRPELLQGRMVG